MTPNKPTVSESQQLPSKLIKRGLFMGINDFRAVVADLIRMSGDKHPTFDDIIPAVMPPANDQFGYRFEVVQ